MIFAATELPGLHVITIEPREDVRGSFARIWCAREFAEHGLDTRLAQCSISRNRRRGTLRGMHFQTAPFEEVKLVRCLRGTIHDVVIDLRPDSPTFRRHLGFELSAENGHGLYVPKGFAHGFQTLVDDCDVLYQMSEFYSPAHGRGVRWNDPAFGMRWPITPPILLDRDASYPDWAPSAVAQ